MLSIKNIGEAKRVGTTFIGTTLTVLDIELLKGMGTQAKILEPELGKGYRLVVDAGKCKLDELKARIEKGEKFVLTCRDRVLKVRPEDNVIEECAALARN